MLKPLVPTLLAMAILSAGPSAACDPEEMLSELRAQCRTAVSAAARLIEPMKSDLAPMEFILVQSRLKDADALCNTDKYADGMAVGAKLARFIGHVEARKGVAPVF
jgi:hypothetical protein